MNRSFRCLVLISTMLSLVSASASYAWDKKATRAAAAKLRSELAGTSFVAKITLGSAQQYYVLPDGTPATESGRRQQGKGGHGSGTGTLWAPYGAVQVKQGERGHSIYPMALKNEIRVGLHRKAGKVLNAAMVHILFDRETVPSDYTAEKIVAALVSLVEVEGYEPGSAVAEAFDEAIDRAAAAVANAPGAADPPTPTSPTVISLQALAEPAIVAGGGEVRLLLVYELAGPSAGVSVTESRTLRLGEQVMPTFPIVDEVTQAPGPVRSSYRQPLPAAIAPGTYVFEGSVCVGADCIQRSVTFEVR